MKGFVWVVVFIFIATLVASISSYFYTLSGLDVGYDDFCIASPCIVSFERMFSGTLKIVEFGASLAYVFVFTGGVYIALKSYRVSVKSSALSGHISHLAMFKEYMEGEIEKLGLLKMERVNVYHWYSLAFPESSEGDISVSEKYRDAISSIAQAVAETNDSISSPKGGYGYRKHQDRMIKALDRLGIQMPYLPKNEFIEVESQVFKLIDSFNHTFTDISVFLLECQRDYV